jgi:hypothetical protein
MAKGAFAEVVSLLLCIAIGFVIGLGLSPWAERFDLPSEFMSSRGQPIALLYVLDRREIVLMYMRVCSFRVGDADSCGDFYGFCGYF